VDKESYKAYLHTPYWREVSRLVKKRFGWRCGVCNSPLELQAHHRTYEHRGDELNHLDDLICLCKICHKLFHKEQRKARKPRKARKRKSPRLSNINI
jgi:predicted HNH restriction endonuclease